MVFLVGLCWRAQTGPEKSYKLQQLSVYQSRDSNLSVLGSESVASGHLGDLEAVQLGKHTVF